MLTFAGDEEQHTLESLTTLAANNVQPRRLVTDGDSGAHRAGDTLYNAGVLATRPIRAHDPNHNARRLKPRVKNANFSAAAFPTAGLRSAKQELQRRLSQDLPFRCSWEHKKAYAHFCGDRRRIKRRMSYVVDCLVRCYQGNHSLCRRTSFVCRPHYRWATHSPYIKKDFVMHLNEEDEKTFRALCNYRIGKINLDFMATLQSTQKCEAVNRGLSACNSKNVTFSRNYAGRMHSAAAQVNRGPGVAMYDQLSATGLRPSAGTRVVRRLLKWNRESDRRREYGRSLKYKVRRYMKKLYLFRKHNEKKEKDTYRPGMVYEEENLPDALTDHSYPKRRKFRPMVL